MRVVHIQYGGPVRKIRDEKGVAITFEDHSYCGPVVLNTKGDPKPTQPGSRASVWRVCSWWAEQGKQIGADGFCIWYKPPEPELIHMGGRHYRVIWPAAAKQENVND